MKTFEITYKDGTKETVKAITQWEALKSHIICSHKLIISIREVE